MDFAPGTFVGDYELIEKAGAGGFSVVWKARRPEDGALRAIKLPLVPELVEHLRREADLSARFAHPQVVPIERVALEAEPPHLVMPWIDGKPLELPEYAAAPREIVRMLETTLDLARVLAALHSAGIAHGDVKPGNVLVDASGRCHLLDLGLARAQMVSKLQRSLAQSLASVDGKSIAGTLEFMAPEIFAGKPPGLASDVYSLGVILHHLLTGRPPAFGVSPSSLNPYLPPGTEDLLRRMLHFDPQARIARAGDATQDLERLIAEERRCLARRNGHARRRVFQARMATLKRGARALLVGLSVPVIFYAGASVLGKINVNENDPLYVILVIPFIVACSFLPFLCLLLGITTINAWVMGVPEKTYKKRKGHPIWSFMMQ